MTQSAHAAMTAPPMPLGHLGHRAAMTQMTQRPVALVLKRAPSPWCSSARTGSHAMTQMTQRRQATRAALDAGRLAGWGLGAPGSGLAGWALAAAGRWPGVGPKATRSKLRGAFARNFFIF